MAGMMGKMAVKLDEVSEFKISIQLIRIINVEDWRRKRIKVSNLNH